MTMTPAYAMNPDNAGIEKRTCFTCGETVKSGRVARVAQCAPCRENDHRKLCGRCAATGQFITGTVNGVPTGPGGVCFRCGGKGYQTGRDRRRNDYYDRHRPVYL